jgi:hypothetical protein
MNTIPFKRTFALGASMLAALAFAVPAFAGEDEDDDDSAPVTQQAPQSSGGGGGGGSDSQHASGGVQTGAGAMATVADDGSVVPLALLGGGALVLTASGLAFRRRVEDAV